MSLSNSGSNHTSATAGISTWQRVLVATILLTSVLRSPTVIGTCLNCSRRTIGWLGRVCSRSRSFATSLALTLSSYHLSESLAEDLKRTRSYSHRTLSRSWSPYWSGSQPTLINARLATYPCSCPSSRWGIVHFVTGHFQTQMSGMTWVLLQRICHLAGPWDELCSIEIS